MQLIQKTNSSQIDWAVFIIYEAQTANIFYIKSLLFVRIIRNV